MSEIKIVDYRPEHQPYFEAFNRVWIEELFEMEPVDEWVLTNPEQAILQPGGAILIAEYNGVPAGTVGLRKTDPFTFEFTKMAVDKNYRRLASPKRSPMPVLKKQATWEQSRWYYIPIKKMQGLSGCMKRLASVMWT